MDGIFYNCITKKVWLVFLSKHNNMYVITKDKAGGISMKLINFTGDKLIKTMFFSIIIGIFCTFGSNVLYANVPEDVRIGLYFNDSQTGQYTALSNFSIDAENGVQLGVFKDNKFNFLIPKVFKNTIIISKYMVGNPMEIYHIKICGGFNSYDDLIDELDKIKKNGIDAYPVYTDEWQIWEGVYPNAGEAEDSISDIIESKLDDKYHCFVIKPSSTRILTLSEDNKVIFIFDNKESIFGISPAPENQPKVFRINKDNEKRYRGNLEVRRMSESDMTLINILPLEEYLYGVVPYEIQANSHMEALKAQSVAARTYSVNNMYKYDRLNFNMCTTVNSQVYRGYNGETASTNRAIDDTKGEIITYNEKPAAVFYFSSSGGKTEDVKNVWGSTNYPYLISVEDKYESGTSWRYQWEVSYTAKKIGEIMANRGFKLGNILGISITKKSAAGRATELIVRGSQDERIYTNSSTRDFLSLDSQWFDITTDADVVVKTGETSYEKTQLAGKKVATGSGLKIISGDVSVVSSGNKKTTIPAAPTIFTFTGRGWGHAVGMSQEGAKGMAENGYKYYEILTHYFPGTKVEQKIGS